MGTVLWCYFASEKGVTHSKVRGKGGERKKKRKRKENGKGARLPWHYLKPLCFVS